MKSWQKNWKAIVGVFVFVIIGASIALAAQYIRSPSDLALERERELGWIEATTSVLNPRVVNSEGKYEVFLRLAEKLEKTTIERDYLVIVEAREALFAYCTSLAFDAGKFDFLAKTRAKDCSKRLSQI